MSTPFAHASEAEIARILDFYEVRWEYEPHTFPILWNLDGDVVESFSPDFYLPELELYVELTTLRQTPRAQEEPQAAPAARALPDLTIKLFYARDFRALMLKYGKIGPRRGAVRDVRPGRLARTAVVDAGRPDRTRDRARRRRADRHRPRRGEPRQPAPPRSAGRAHGAADAAAPLDDQPAIR